MNGYTYLLIFFSMSLALPECISQERGRVGEVKAAIMKAAIKYDIAREKEYDIQHYSTIVLDKQVEKQGLEVIDMTSNPDSILYYAYSYGASGLAKLVAQDSSWVGVIREYNARSGEVSRIRRGDLQIDGSEIQLISNGSLQRIFKRKYGWTQFYKKFPAANGLYRVSSPVIRGNKAVLYFSQSKGGLSGVGCVFLLEKKETWEVIHFVELWVS